ncbi:MAG: right-handed parallel beta-helix repeat-containing protein [Deltaproteobacteria bacterium]|nr:right-handed parallel beta-helix repeat-containing protein [Deltaproteobacteria bacterium]
MRKLLVVSCLVAAASCSDGADSPGIDAGADAEVGEDAGADPEPDGGADAEVPAPRTLFVDDLADGEAGSGTEADPFRNLQVAIDDARDGDTIRLMPGRFVAEPSEYTDPTCGNCGDADFRADIPATAGFIVSGKGLHILGSSRDESIIETSAGYGVLFESAGESTLEQVTVTGGLRDADGRATDAGIVVRHTSLVVKDVDVVENDDLYQGEPDPIVGIIGIAGREGAELTVIGCRIENNSWDGIAMYRSDPDVAGSAATALVVHTTIGCTSGCVNPRGRGVGIGVTWDAEAVIVNSRIHHQWKGIGSFGTSRVTALNNIVSDQVGWGVIASGQSWMEAINNVIVANGTTGLAAWDPSASGRFVNNVVTGNGWSTDEWVGKRTGVWMNASNSFDLAYNDVWGNETQDVCTGGVPGADPCSPIELDAEDGNVSVDPRFEDTVDYGLLYSSALIDAGDPAILDLDGTRSDMGVHGGPEAGRVE